MAVNIHQNSTVRVVDASNLKTTHHDDSEKGAPAVVDAPYSVLPPGEKIFVILAGSFAALISPLSSSVYLPALNSLARDMDVSVSLINLTITTYLVPFLGIEYPLLRPLTASRFFKGWPRHSLGVSPTAMDVAPGT